MGENFQGRAGWCAWWATFWSTFSDFWSFGWWCGHQNSTWPTIHVFNRTSTSFRQFCTLLVRRNWFIENLVPIGFQDDHKTTVLWFLTLYSQEGGKFLDHMLTGDGTGVSHMTPESKLQSMHWRHTNVANQSQSEIHNFNTTDHGNCLLRQEMDFVGQFYAERLNNQFWCVLCDLEKTPVCHTNQAAWFHIFRCDVAPWQCKATYFCTNISSNEVFWMESTGSSTLDSRPCI